jgi:murein DD-endopeptidase MepM/ murein hydrolase activator NlpD
MKRYCVPVLALLFWGRPSLFAESIPGPLASSATAVSSATVADEPFVWPVSNVIAQRKIQIVSKFGRRKVPLIPGLDTSTVIVPGEEMHEGVDFSVPPESPVCAARSGKVLFAGFSTAYVSRQDKKDKNHLVIVRHADGKSTRYVHLDRLLVRPGQDLKAGDILGKSSRSDEWTEPVVHFEIREKNGQAVDPMPFFAESQKGPAK